MEDERLGTQGLGEDVGKHVASGDVADLDLFLSNPLADVVFRDANVTRSLMVGWVLCVRRRSAYASRRPRADLCGLTLALARGAAASLDLSPFSSLSSPANYTV
ncbi:BQ5605_C009g05610 [Microbotryum silenes-dioicae]|uniref:BQ5605_C009g05610 protein n=1 Tax=Microbotryum silenes-dioicae TaxID=796604 RepID=A0A2X0PF15_9BASI|nr:BQ5605_C009g05610 [Microbotryum silenes-dioicae]